MKLGIVESHFANIIWENEPLSSRKLVELCEERLNWKQTTTYTVLKKLCQKGIFQNKNSMITSLISRKEFYAIQSEEFVEETFQGSLPAFVAAFTTRKPLSNKEIEELYSIINAMKRDDE